MYLNKQTHSSGKWTKNGTISLFIWLLSHTYLRAEIASCERNAFKGMFVEYQCFWSEYISEIFKYAFESLCLCLTHWLRDGFGPTGLERRSPSSQKYNHDRQNGSVQRWTWHLVNGITGKGLMIWHFRHALYWLWSQTKSPLEYFIVSCQNFCGRGAVVSCYRASWWFKLRFC